MLVLDANILIRAVLGSRVLGLLRKHAGQVEFAPDVAFQEAREHLPGILASRNIPAAPAMATLKVLAQLIEGANRTRAVLPEPTLRLPSEPKFKVDDDADTCAS